MKFLKRLLGSVESLATLGIQNEDLRDCEPLRKRIRLVNILCLICGAIGFFSLPFDFFTAPRWMIAEDVVSAAGFLAIPFLNRSGYYGASRMLFLLFANVLFLWNIAFMTSSAGVYLIFFPIAGFGAMLFEGKERLSLFFAIAVPVAAYFYSVRNIGGSEHEYFLYSSAANFLLICAGFFFLQRTGDQAEAALKRSRTTMILSEKMAALGEMSGGVAHEINTPLLAIRLNTDLLRRHLVSPLERRKEIESALASIDRVSERITRITRALQSFSRSAENDPPVVASIETIVSEAVELCRERFKNAEVELEVAPIAEGATIECRPVQISQVILNLLNNAFSAISDLPEKWIQLRVTAKGPRVEISVTDSGNGVATEIQDRIFQPFFTTKGPGFGTGLGLSISKGIIEEHEGRIFLAKDSPHTRFVVDLPRDSGSVVWRGK